MIKILLTLFILVAIGVGAFIFFAPSTPPRTRTKASNVAPKAVSCLDGEEGNSGDNYCSNTHGVSSKCRPGFAGDFTDGCTQNTPAGQPGGD